MSVTPDEFRAAVAAAATNTATAQATIAEQGARIERVLTAVEAIISTQSTTGAPPASSHAPSASSASSSAGTMPDGTPTEQSHGLHTPARADTFDMLHREKNLLSKITDRRLEPFNQDVEDQISQLLAQVITPQMEVPMEFSSFDAYCRQTNAIDEAITSRIDEYQSTHSSWKDEGGAGGTFRHRGVLLEEGITHKNARMKIIDEVTKKLEPKHPKVPEYTQDMVIDDPLGTIIVDKNGNPRRRKKGDPDSEVLEPTGGRSGPDPDGFYDDTKTENMIMRISNDPCQWPYRGKFEAGRALDKFAYLARDLCWGRILTKFTEQADIGRAELKCHAQIQKLDPHGDAISFNVMRLLKEEFPTFNSDTAQHLRQQYEGARYDENYYFSDFVNLLMEINTELEKCSKKFRIPDKHVFVKVKTFMMAVFDTDKGGDALSKFYHETALILTQEGVETQTDHEKKICKDLSFFVNWLVRAESERRVISL